MTSLNLTTTRLFRWGIFCRSFSWNFLLKSSMDPMCNQALETSKKKECQRVNSNENPIENLLPQLLSLYTKRSSWTSPQCVLSAFSVAIQMSNNSSRSKSILMVTSWTAHTCTIRLDLQISKEMSDRSVALHIFWKALEMTIRATRALASACIVSPANHQRIASDLLDGKWFLCF